MARKLVTWLVAALGAALMISGVAAMWTGWGVIQVERGWSLFIGGSTALSGGTVVLALAVVIARLDAMLSTVAPKAARSPEKKQATAPAPKPAVSERAAPVASDSPVARERRPVVPVDVAPPPEPEEVDRYESGDTTYVMYSDGSVELRKGGVSRRYESLARLREEAAQRY